MKYYLFRILCALSLAVTTAGIWAQPAAATNAEAERKAALEAARQAQVTGPAQVTLLDQATLKLPAGYAFVPTPAAAKLLESMGNRVGDSLLGLVFPAGGENWFTVIRYINEGHIKDDDAKDWNADDLLTSLREGTESANAERTRRGIPAMEVIGWTEKPRYDAATHRLVWSASTRDKGSTDTRDLGVNYNTYALGREGYISLNLVTALDELPRHQPAALELLGALEYKEGRRYADFNSSTDKVAAYGLATLVAGAAAKKLGLLAVILAFIAKFAKVFVLAGGALLWGLVKLFGGRRAAKPKPAASHPDPEPQATVPMTLSASSDSPAAAPPKPLQGG